MFLLAVDLLEGDVKGRHDSGPLLAVGHHVVFVVEKLEVDQVIDLLCTMMTQIIKLIKGVCIVLEVMIFGLGRHKINIVLPLVVVYSKLLRIVHQLDLGSHVGRITFGDNFIGLQLLFYWTKSPVFLLLAPR